MYWMQYIVLTYGDGLELTGNNALASQNQGSLLKLMPKLLGGVKVLSVD